MLQPRPPSFSVISGAQVHGLLSGRERRVVALIEDTYRLHGEGSTVNPDSYFLRFPEQPSDRIIALPASLRGGVNVHGMKWISSFPANVANGLPRASAVLILNDAQTGYPFACLESSIISASRTAASAALAASALSKGRGARPRRVAFIGAGLIARYVHTYLDANGFVFDEIGVHDTSPENARGFAGYLEGTGDVSIVIHQHAEEAIRASDLVVFATVAGKPHVHETNWFAHCPLVLHLSLRDLAPEVILGSWNAVDDIEHCLKADTSPHLAAQATGGRDFIAGTLYDVLTGRVTPPDDQPVIFSPFGLGVLDLAVAKYIYDQIASTGELTFVPDFFHDTKRYG